MLIIFFSFSQLTATQLTLRFGWKSFSKSKFCWKPPHSFQGPRYLGFWNATDLTDFCTLTVEFLPGMTRGGSCQALNPGAGASRGRQGEVFIWAEEWCVSPSCSVIKSSGKCELCRTSLWTNSKRRTDEYGTQMEIGAFLQEGVDVG